VTTAQATDHTQTAITAQSFEQRLLEAETRLPSDIRATNELLAKITESETLPDNKMSLRLVLLQAYRNILLGKLDVAGGQLDAIEEQQSSRSTFSRILYFRAIIAQKRLDFEQVFLLLNRIDQLDAGEILFNHRFDIYILASTIHALANANDNAIGFANKALAIAQKNDNSLLACRAINSLSFIYLNNKKYSALYDSANAVMLRCNNDADIGELAHAYRHIAAWHSAQEQHQQAREALHKAIELYGTIESPLHRAITQLRLAKSLMTDNRLLEADVQLAKAMVVIESSSDLWAKTQGYIIKANLLEGMGLLDDAMFYFKRYLKAQKASNSQTKLLNIAYLQRRFESKVNRQAVEISRVEAQLSRLRIERESLKNWIYLLSSLLIGSISLFLFTFYKRKQSLSLIEQQQLDELTQCYSLDYGLLKANEVAEAALNRYQNVGVILCNIDKMEQINLSYNYDFGDILLHSFALKLIALQASDMLVIRKRGDEFMLVFTHCSCEQLLQLTRKIHPLLDNVTIDNQKISVSVSCGCAHFDSNHNQINHNVVDELMAHANMALKAAKSEEGSGGYYYEDGTLKEVTLGASLNPLAATKPTRN